MFFHLNFVGFSSIRARCVWGGIKNDSEVKHKETILLRILLMLTIFKNIREPLKWVMFYK